MTLDDRPGDRAPLENGSSRVLYRASGLGAVGARMFVASFLVALGASQMDVWFLHQAKVAGTARERLERGGEHPVGA